MKPAAGATTLLGPLRKAQHYCHYCCIGVSLVVSLLIINIIGWLVGTSTTIYGQPRVRSSFLQKHAHLETLNTDFWIFILRNDKLFIQTLYAELCFS